MGNGNEWRGRSLKVANSQAKGLNFVLMTVTDGHLADRTLERSRFWKAYALEFQLP
jgi:hypothetical protein